MSRLFSMKSFGLSVLAVALAVAFTPSAHAQEAQNQVAPLVSAVGAHCVVIDAAHPAQLFPAHEKDLMAPKYQAAQQRAAQPASDDQTAPQETAAPPEEQR